MQDSKEKYDRAIALLRDSQRTTFILVMRPDRLSLFETQRAFTELEGIGVQSAELIVNGVLPQDVCDTDFFKTQYDLQQEIIREADRARADLKAAGIEVQTVVANMVLPDEACANDYFLNRKSMQAKYLAEIDKTFTLPVIRIPHVTNEIRGINMIREIARSI